MEPTEWVRPCGCIPCSECFGTGHAWQALDGEYLGNSRCDDMDELVTCDWCNGSGYEFICEDCQLDEEED